MHAIPALQRASLVGLGLLAVSRGDESFRFDVAPATEVTKTFVESTTWTLESLGQHVGSIEVQTGERAMSGTTRRTRVYSDTYLDVSGGRAVEVARRVSELSGSSAVEAGGELGADNQAFELASDLEGADLRASWDAIEEQYVFRYADERGDAALLEGLRFDTDFLALLPTEDVSAGESWPLDLELLRDVLVPGGATHLAPVALGELNGWLEVDDVLGTGILTLEDMAQTIEGEATATWKETFEVDGTEFARVTVAVELEIAGSVESVVERWRDELDVQSSREGLTMRYSRDLEGEAELVWNLSAGRFESFAFESESYIEGVMRWDEEPAISVDLELNATTKLTASAE